MTLRRASPTRASLAALALALHGPAAAQVGPAAADAGAAAPARLTSDAQRETPGGTTFTAPSGWTVSPRGTSAVVLEPEEPDSRLVLIDLPAQDADAAVAAAWAAYRPDMKRPLKIAVDRPPRNGWDQRRLYDYETSPNEQAVVYAVALRHGSAWTVLLVDAKEATYERRAAAVALVGQSLRPKGYRRESFAGKAAHPLDASRIELLAGFLETARHELGVPGVGFSLIDAGRVVFEGGLGVRELGRPQPVDANTLFLAASNTKALTTLLLARLVDAGKLGWEQPVVEVFPGFRLGDADTTRRVLVKHLVCACTGLPRQDLEWVFEFAKATPASALALLGTMQPTTRFGEVFQYSNLLAAAAGYVAAHVLSPDLELGAAYDRAMRTQVFLPLGMRATTFDFARALKQDHASPHGEDVDGKQQLARVDPNRTVIAVRPAGGLWTSAHDLSRYLLMELAGGRLPDGARFVSEHNLLARRLPQVSIGEDQTYGMGLMVDTTWGVPVVHHGGDLFGYHSDMIWLPEQKVGAVLLTNADSGVLLRRGFTRRLLEVLFDGRPEAAEDVASLAAARRASIAKERERLVVPADPAESAKLAARYRSSALGELRVSREGSSTIFDFGEWKSPVASRRNDDGTISFLTVAPTLGAFELVAGTRDGKRVLVIRDAQHEYVFVEG